jgi:spermidine synthase
MGTRTARADILTPVELGTAELVADPDRPRGWMLLIDGVPQSYVDTSRPALLRFAYVRRVAAVIDAIRPAGTAIDALHLGGGAWTLPRYVAATRPGSYQLIVERDRGLADLIAERLPMRPADDVEVVTGDARDVVEAAPDDDADLIIGDVYQGAVMPEHVTTVEFATEVARVLRPDGLYVVNVAGPPLRTFTRRLTATLRACFTAVAVVPAADTPGDRRSGNTVLVAAGTGRRIPVRALTTARPGETGRIAALHGAALDDYLDGARPLRD